ncbi:thrombospondin type 3 repeat-containing protein [Pseudomonadales bacterium]|nr:thrombospondin type 3 repeat-containing protein [Pseudomonadales bacterium]
MIKKQLGLLAGSVMMAAGSDAAITLGGDTLVVFNTAGAGSYYQLVGGSTGDSLVEGESFYVDVSAATAALGGTIDSFAVLAINSTECSPSAPYPCFNYDEVLYVQANGGLVYAGASAVSTSNRNAENTISNIQGVLNAANLGLNPEGSLGDFDADARVSGFLNNGTTNMIFNAQTELGPSTNAVLTGYVSLDSSTSTLSYTYTGAPPIPSPTIITFPTQGSLITIVTPITVTVESGSDKVSCRLSLNGILIEEDFSAPYEFSAPPLDSLADGNYNLQANCFDSYNQQTSDLIAFEVNTPVMPDYSQDFNDLLPADAGDTADDSELENDGWVFFGSALKPAEDPNGYFQYGSYEGIGGAPNNVVGAFSGVNVDGLDPSGNQFLNVFANYNQPERCDVSSVDASGNATCDTSVDPTAVVDTRWQIKATVYRELGIISTADSGKTVTFDFDARRPDDGSAVGVSCVSPCTAAAFIRTIDPSNGYATTNNINLDTSAIALGTWQSYSLKLDLNNLEGQILDFGFENVNRGYDTSSVNYDNVSISFSPTPSASATSITAPTQGSVIATGTPITVLVESGTDKVSCSLLLNNILIEEDFSAPYEFTASPLDNLAGGTYNLQASCLSVGGEQTSDEITFTANAPSTITGDLNAEIEQAGVVSGTVIATDPDGLTDGSYFTLKTDATYGQALINPESGFWIYLADLNYYGPDPFTITVTDDLNYTTDQEISINVQCFDDDEDTVCNVEDNCPAISNPLQEDLDFDDEGDACDADIDGDTYANGIDAFPNDPSEWFDTDGDNTGDNTDNCINKINVDQSDIDSDTLGDVCDDDMDNDGVPNIVELRFGGNQTDANDAATSLTNFALYAENAEADDDFDGFSNTIELAANTNPNDASDAPQAELNILEALSITKTVPAIGGIGLFVMFSSLIGLGFLKRKKN